MKITFESVQEQNIQGQSGVEKRHSSTQNTEKKAEKTGAYSVNIGGQDGRGPKDSTYKKENLTAEEISMQASGMDMDVQKMYMAVMSNSMSQDEFNEMLEDGYNVADMDIETLVTILDRIKVEVAKGGGDISGFTDSLSKETLEQILGSSAYAEAFKNGLEEGAIAYMVDRQMPPTPENLYRAKYSAGTGQGLKEQELPDMESEEGKAFWEQIDKVIGDAGLHQDKESREDAAFLLRHDIPVTKENLQAYERLKDFEKGGKGLSEEELKYRIAMQIYEGKAAYQADLSREAGIYEEAVSLYKAVQKITAETVEQTIAEHSEEEITLKDLIEKQEESNREGAPGLSDGQKADTDHSGKQITEAAESTKDSRGLLIARRQLEEVRLRMSVEANIKLLRSGFKIDTAPMEQLIERLKAAEEALSEQGIPQAEEALQKIEELRGMPAYTLSYVVSREISFTIEALHEKGSELQADFEKAGTEKARQDEARQRYETMQTEVRPDLGDSIRKAFRNVDDILADMNKEPSEENRRAVRMLGYNRLEITEENLERAMDADRKVQTLFRDMKPGRVLQMIRDGVDVLHTDIEELDARLTAQKSEFVEESEDFARFLHKLDKNGTITAEERENYIGIYRLIRQVEKADGKAEGYLLGSDAQFTMENLLKAVRSGKKGYMDYRIDEEFSGVDALQRGKSIIDQINAAPYENSESYEATRQVLEGTEKKSGQREEEAADFLKEMHQPVTVSNLLEASAVLQEDAGIYQKIEDYEKEIRKEKELEAEESRLEGYVMRLQESVGDETSLQEGMGAFAEQTEEILREAENQGGVRELDIRDLQQICRGLRFRAALAKESRYQIPVKLDEGYTIMNLTVRRGAETAQAEISMETEEHGRIEAVFAETGEAEETGADTGNLKAGIRGNLFAETESGIKLLQSVAEKVQEKLQNTKIAVEDITVMRGRYSKKEVFQRASGGERTDASATEKGGQKEISTGELYQIAKIFLETVRK